MTFRACFTAAFAMCALAAAPANAAVNLIVNGGFEAADIAPGGYLYPAQGSTVDSWYYYGPAIVDGTGPGAWWPDQPAPPQGFEGDQFAALQTTGVLAQTFSFGGGRLQVSWLDAGRPYSYSGCCNGDQTYRVTLYSWDTGQFHDIGQYQTTSGQAFTSRSGAVDLGAGSYALIFQGLATSDQTAFIDGVSAGGVPEPAAWALMILGFGGAGSMLRRRRAVVAGA